jgi:hypothetical protein
MSRSIQWFASGSASRIKPSRRRPAGQSEAKRQLLGRTLELGSGCDLSEQSTTELIDQAGRLIRPEDEKVRHLKCRISKWSNSYLSVSQFVGDTLGQYGHAEMLAYERRDLLRTHVVVNLNGRHTSYS